MSRLLLLGALLLALLAPISTVGAAGAAPNSVTVRDPRGDQRSTGSLTAAERASVDIRALVVRRDFRQLHLTLRVADVRGFDRSRQRATVVLTGLGLARQTFTSAGTRIVKTSGSTTRSCGAATRDPARDTVTMRLPFRCIRSIPAGLDLVARYEVGPTSRDSTRGRATDETRPVLVDPR